MDLKVIEQAQGLVAAILAETLSLQGEDLREYSNAVRRELFLDAGLCERIAESLKLIAKQRRELLALPLEWAELNPPGTTVSKCKHNLKEFARRQSAVAKFADAVEFFLKLTSSTEGVAPLLEAQQKGLNSKAIYKLEEAEAARLYGKYVQLEHAITAANEDEQFLSLLSLAGQFDAKLLLAVHKKSLISCDSLPVGENSAGESLATEPTGSSLTETEEQAVVTTTFTTSPEGQGEKPVVEGMASGFVTANEAETSATTQMEQDVVGTLVSTGESATPTNNGLDTNEKEEEQPELLSVTTEDTTEGETKEQTVVTEEDGAKPEPTEGGEGSTEDISTTPVTPTLAGLTEGVAVPEAGTDLNKDIAVPEPYVINPALYTDLEMVPSSEKEPKKFTVKTLLSELGRIPTGALAGKMPESVNFQILDEVIKNVGISASLIDGMFKRLMLGAVEKEEAQAIAEDKLEALLAQFERKGFLARYHLPGAENSYFYTCPLSIGKLLTSEKVQRYFTTAYGVGNHIMTVDDVKKFSDMRQRASLLLQYLLYSYNEKMNLELRVVDPDVRVRTACDYNSEFFLRSYRIYDYDEPYSVLYLGLGLHTTEEESVRGFITTIEKFLKRVQEEKDIAAQTGEYVVIAMGVSYEQAQAELELAESIFTKYGFTAHYAYMLMGDSTIYDQDTKEHLDITTYLGCFRDEPSSGDTIFPEEEELTEEDEEFDEDIVDLGDELAKRLQEIKAQLKAFTTQETSTKVVLTKATDMILNDKPYCATTYLRQVAELKGDATLSKIYREIAMALNDPLAQCDYSVNGLESVFATNNYTNHPAFVASALRVLTQDELYQYESSAIELKLLADSYVQKSPSLKAIMRAMLDFRRRTGSGLLKYAHSSAASDEQLALRLAQLRQEAAACRKKYIGKDKNNTGSYRYRYLHDEIFSETGTVATLLGYVEQVALSAEDIKSLEEALVPFLKNGTEARRDNLDEQKLSSWCDTVWETLRSDPKVDNKYKTAQKAANLQKGLCSHLRQILSVVCDCVALNSKRSVDTDEKALLAYSAARESILSSLGAYEEEFVGTEALEPEESLGEEALRYYFTELEKVLLREEETSPYSTFYVPFLRAHYVELDSSYLPVLTENVELEALSTLHRIEEHYLGEEVTYEKALSLDIRDGYYGRAEQLLDYLESKEAGIKERTLASEEYQWGFSNAQHAATRKVRQFTNHLELRECYGQIRSGSYLEKVKQCVNAVYEKVKQTHDYAYLSEVIAQYEAELDDVAKGQEEQMAQRVEQSKELYGDAKYDPFYEQIRHAMSQHNYAAVEDLLNRMRKGDEVLTFASEGNKPLESFLRTYQLTYQAVSDNSKSLKMQVHLSGKTKDSQRAEAMVEAWPSGSSAVDEERISTLLEKLGFRVGEVRREQDIERFATFAVKLRSASCGRKSNYQHPVAAFGSEAERKEFRIICLFGAYDASRLIDIMHCSGEMKDLIILLDSALPLPERRKLARLVRARKASKLALVIDRVVMNYLSRYYQETSINRMLMQLITPFGDYQPYIADSATVMPPEIFMGRKEELNKIEAPTGVNLVYGGRQLGKSALLRQAYNDIDQDENKDRAILLDIKGFSAGEVALAVSRRLRDSGIIPDLLATEDWNGLAYAIERRLMVENTPEIGYLLLLLDEADTFITSCGEVGYSPIDALRKVQLNTANRFKFVLAGLHDVLRFNQKALSDNSSLPHLSSLTVKPFNYQEARELLEEPLSFLGFTFPEDEESNALITTIFSSTNYFPGLIQLYGEKLIAAMREKDYAGFNENDSPQYRLTEELMGRVLGQTSVQEEIRRKFDITLQLGTDDYYKIIALIVAYLFQQDSGAASLTAQQVEQIAIEYGITKLTCLGTAKIASLMEEMCELNVLQHASCDEYRFARSNFSTMLGTAPQVEEAIAQYMGVE